MKITKETKRTMLYGIIKPNSNHIKFDDTKLMKKELLHAIKLQKLEVFYGNNADDKETLLGMKCEYINYVDGVKIEGNYFGCKLEPNKIEKKEINLEMNDYFSKFEINFDDYINYIKITTKNDKCIEFGNPELGSKTILNYEGDNMIQLFWGYYKEEEGILSIGFQYVKKMNFYFFSVFTLLKFRYLLLKDIKFKNKLANEHKELLKNNIPMEYLYRACLLPDTVFSKIVKYC